MKVYCVDGAPGDLAEISRICAEKGWSVQVARPFGRPAASRPVHEVLDAFSLKGSVRGAAAVVGISPGTAWRILRESGAIGEMAMREGGDCASIRQS